MCVTNRTAFPQAPKPSTAHWEVTFLGVPLIRIRIFWGLYIGVPHFGKLLQHKLSDAAEIVMSSSKQICFMLWQSG